MEMLTDNGNPLPRKGDIVAPNNTGTKVNWTVFRGRLVDTWTKPDGEAVGDVLWFNEAKTVLGRKTTGKPLAMLETVIR
jgi:hypothetical protein